MASDDCTLTDESVITDLQSPAHAASSSRVSHRELPAEGPTSPRQAARAGRGKRIGLRSAVITGTGGYLPDRVLTNADLEKMVDTSDEWITARTGIKERRIAAPDQAASDLALRAARQAIAESRVTPEDIDLILVATVTGDMLFPSTACIIYLYTDI